MSSPATARTERIVNERLVLSERLKLAIDASIDEYAFELNGDPRIRAVKVEVRVKPGGEIRAVIVDRQSEIVEG